jgi:hypothetical protein
MTFDEACQAILDDPKANGYAKAYAKAGLGMVGHACNVQALYILNNIQHWRGPVAKQVRAVLKAISHAPM